MEEVFCRPHKAWQDVLSVMFYCTLLELYFNELDELVSDLDRASVQYVSACLAPFSHINLVMLYVRYEKSVRVELTKVHQVVKLVGIWGSGCEIAYCAV